MAKTLSYSFLVISNRLRRSESACKTKYESAGDFATLPHESCLRSSPAEVRNSLVSGKEISDKLKIFFARPGSLDMILASLKPRGYAGIQALATMIINDICAREPIAVVTSEPPSRNRSGLDVPEGNNAMSIKAQPTSTSLKSAAHQAGPVTCSDDGVVRDVRPWLSPGASWFPITPCKYFLQGRCHKADDCTFLHRVTSEHIRKGEYGIERTHETFRKGNLDRQEGFPAKSSRIGLLGVDRGSGQRSYAERRGQDRCEPESRHADPHMGEHRLGDRSSDYSRGSDRSYTRSIRGEDYSTRTPRSSERYASRHSSRSPRGQNRRLPSYDYQSSEGTYMRRDDRQMRNYTVNDEYRSVGSVSRDYSYDRSKSDHGPGSSRRVSSTHQSRERSTERSIRCDRQAEPASLPTDSFKNAELLLEKAIQASGTTKVQSITMLDRYLTLQSKLPKVNHNIHIFEYLLNMIEMAPPAQQPRYFRFLQRYLELVDRDTSEFGHIHGMMRLAEQSTGDIRARAVPLLDRYMNLASTIDFTTSTVS